MTDDTRITTVSASSQVGAHDRGRVVVSGSYGGEYNAYHAAKWGLRGVVLNDAGIGKDRAGVRGLDYLDGVGLAAATADCMTCHIADGEHMLAHGRISHVNAAAEALGCVVGQTVAECAERMRAGPIVERDLPAIAGGKRFLLRHTPGEPPIVALDAAPMLEPSDAGAIAVTGSHAALFRGQPDDVIKPQVHAIFFSDGGVGLDGAGVRRLPELDRRGIPAGAISSESGPIGDARGLYRDGILSHVNETARSRGGRPGQKVSEFIDALAAQAAAGGRRAAAGGDPPERGA